MRLILAALVVLLSLSAAPAAAQEAQGTLTVAQAAEAIETRWRGEIIAITLTAGRPHERTDVVYEARILTDEGAVVATVSYTHLTLPTKA
jgi:hypothetical protein